MKLVTFRIGSHPARSGALADGGRSIVALWGRAFWRSCRAATTPWSAPPQMRDFLCFEKHLVQAFGAVAKMRGTDPRVPKVWYERPLFYHPNRFNVCGTGAEVPWPAFSERMDFELEFGCWIGTTGKDIARERAREHIFGYSVFNDFSARVLGPCLVTGDEIKNVYELDMIARVNGEEWGRGNSRDMHWKFEDCIAHASRSETLHPGEFFGSVVELEVEGIGVLRNRIVK